MLDSMITEILTNTVWGLDMNFSTMMHLNNLPARCVGSFDLFVVTYCAMFLVLLE